MHIISLHRIIEYRSKFTSQLLNPIEDQVRYNFNYITVKPYIGKSFCDDSNILNLKLSLNIILKVYTFIKLKRALVKRI